MCLDADYSYQCYQQSDVTLLSPIFFFSVYIEKLGMRR